MSEKVANIAKNTSFFTLALILQKLISFAYFTIYARELGPADLGKYYFALSVTTIFSLAVDLGIVNYITREVAKRREQAQHFLSLGLGVKSLLSLLTVAALAAVVEGGAYEPLVRQLIYVAALSMLCDGFTALFFGINRAFHNLKYESLTAVLSQLLTLVFSLWVLAGGRSLVWLMLAQVASSALSLGLAAFSLAWRWRLSFKPNFSWAAIKLLLWASLPFGLYLLAQRLQNYFDSVLLYRLAGDVAVGVYQIPAKIAMALQFLPAAFIASLYPALSHYWQHNRQQLAVTFERAINYSLLLALPITAGQIAITDNIIELMKGGYAEAAWPLRLTALATFFTFINYPVGSLLNACDRAKANTTNMMLAAGVSIGINLLTIPKFGAIGAATALALSNAVLFALNWRVGRALVAAKLNKMYLVFIKAAAASLLMAGLVWALKPHLNIFLVIAAAAVFYGTLLLVLGAVKRADLASIVKSFSLKKA